MLYIRVSTKERRKLPPRGERCKTMRTIVVPNLLTPKLHKHFLSSENAKAAYKMGVLTLIFGSFLKGVFDIYGTHSVYPSFYLPVGLLLLLVALCFEIHQRKGRAK